MFVDIIRPSIYHSILNSQFSESNWKIKNEYFTTAYFLKIYEIETAIKISFPVAHLLTKENYLLIS